MRNALCRALTLRAATHPAMVFLTGDLGFMALEPLQELLGPRFINCGIAEQNMISVAAGLARAGHEVWVYSIAPFVYARPFEQIRNDLCFHRLPVRLIGNGGGLAYGSMGPSHHAVDDYGALLTLPDLRVLVPSFSADLAPMIAQTAPDEGPIYFRLGSEVAMPTPLPSPAYAPWREILMGTGPLVLTTGPLAGLCAQAITSMEASDLDSRPALWAVDAFPLRDIPDAFWAHLAEDGRLCVIEEHVAHGGLGAMIAQEILGRGLALKAYRHLSARHALSGRTGSQNWLRHAQSCDAEALIATLRAMDSGKKKQTAA